MVPAEILQRHAIAHRAGGKAQPLFQDFHGIGAGHRVHRVKRHGQAIGHGGADRGKVEQGFHQVGIVGHRIDHRNLAIAHGHAAAGVQVDVRRVHRQPAVDRLGAGIDRLGHAFGAGPPLAMLYLMPKSSSGPPGLWLAERIKPPLAL
jgi:hypothetical protein